MKALMGEQGRIKLAISYTYLAVLMVMHLSVVLAVWHSQIPKLFLILILLFLFGHVAYLCMRHCYDYSLAHGVQLKYTGDDWLLSTPEGWRDVELRSPVYIGHYFLLLQFRLSPRGRRSVMIWRDSCTPDEFRRLRVFLRNRRNLLG